MCASRACSNASLQVQRYSSDSAGNYLMQLAGDPTVAPAAAVAGSAARTATEATALELMFPGDSGAWLQRFWRQRVRSAAALAAGQVAIGCVLPKEQLAPAAKIVCCRRAATAALLSAQSAAKYGVLGDEGHHAFARSIQAAAGAVLAAAGSPKAVTVVSDLSAEPSHAVERQQNVPQRASAVGQLEKSAWQADLRLADSTLSAAWNRCRQICV